VGEGKMGIRDCKWEVAKCISSQINFAVMDFLKEDCGSASILYKTKKFQFSREKKYNIKRKKTHLFSE